MHELVCDRRPAGSETRAIDVSKRLMDFSSHPPSNYFTLIEREAPMVEATEAEGKEALDAFAEAILTLAGDPARARELAKNARHRAEEKYSYERYLEGTRRVFEFISRLGGGAGAVVPSGARPPLPRRKGE